MRSCCGIGSGKRSLPVLIGLLVAAAVCPAQDYVDQVVERARHEFDVPGIAVAIVKDGNVVLAKGYGVRKLGEAGAGDGPLALPHRLQYQSLHGGGAGHAGGRRQAPVGRRGDPAHARFPDVRPVRHPRDHRAGPAGASQRAGAGRGRPDVLPAHRPQPRRDHPAAAVRQAGHQFPQPVRL